MDDPRAGFLSSLGMTEDDIVAVPAKSSLKSSGGTDGWDKIRASEKGSCNKVVFDETSEEMKSPPCYGRRSPNPPVYEAGAAHMGGGKPKAGRRSETALSPDLQREVDTVGPDTSPTQLKEIGNKCFQAKNYTNAIRLYTRAMEVKNNDPVLYSNRSAAYLQSPMISGPLLALQDAEKCVDLKTSWFKGWSRMGDALFKQRKFEKAKEAYCKGLQLDPNNENLKQSIEQCTSELEQFARMQHHVHHAEENSSGEDLNSTRSSFEDIAAAGRSFRDLELMKYRHRTSDSRPSSRSDSSSYATTSGCDESGSVSGTEAARSYKENLLQSFRSKKTAPQPVASSGGATPYTNYSDTNYTTRSFPQDTKAATDFVGKAISADSYNTLTYRDKHF